MEYFFSDYKKTKTMFNNWESALADNTSKDLFGTKFEEETCRSKKKKKKKKSKDIFKGIASSNQPFGRGALPNRDDRRRRNRGFTFSFIGLNFT